jgi:hypothetical protein
MRMNASAQRFAWSGAIALIVARARRAMFIPSLLIIIPLAIIFFAIMALW